VPTEQHAPKAFPTVQVEPHENVLQDGHVLEQRRVLKGAHQTAGHDVMGFETCKTLADKGNGAGSGWQKTAQEVETGSFSGAIRTNKPDNLTLLNSKIDTIDSGESAKILRQVLCFQECHMGLALPLGIALHRDMLPWRYPYWTWPRDTLSTPPEEAGQLARKRDQTAGEKENRENGESCLQSVDVSSLLIKKLSANRRVTSSRGLRGYQRQTPHSSTPRR
jgi:hypothetical protein